MGTPGTGEGYETKSAANHSYLLRFARPPTSGGQFRPAAVAVRKGKQKQFNLCNVDVLLLTNILWWDAGWHNKAGRLRVKPPRWLCMVERPENRITQNCFYPPVFPEPGFFYSSSPAVQLSQLQPRF